MAYIYKIINKVNNKLYIGQTSSTLQKRWCEHIKDSKKGLINRPLYSAFDKYGIENFEMVLLEETDSPSEREIYYIQKLRTYIGFKDSNGYNATLGGEGSTKLLWDKEKEQELYITYTRTKSVKKTAEILGHDKSSISKKLKEMGFKIEGRSKKAVYKIDEDTEEILEWFPSASEAARHLGVNQKDSHIGKVCRGERTTAYGFK